MSFAQPFENFEILERVGAGAMGTVFKARQKHLGRIVALKVLKPSLARDERYVARMRREAQIVGRLNHANIVTAYDVGEEGGYHFFVMEFVAGRSLKQLLAEWGRFPEERVLQVATQLTEALAHAHELGVVHRDVKPGNVLIEEEGRVKLTDMGLAKAKTDLTLTRDGATVGTPQYISPEQARDAQDVDARTDLYSLGATMFHMATGQPPFRAETIGELIHQVLHVPAPHATDVYPQLGDGLSLVIRKLLAKDRGLRYQTAAELLEDLRRVQRRERPHADRDTLDAEQAASGPAGLPRPSRRRWSWGRAALATGLLGGVLGWLAGAWSGLGAGGSAAGGPSRVEFDTRIDAALAVESRARERLELLASLSAGSDAVGFGDVLLERRAALLEDLDRAVEDRIASWVGTRRAETVEWLRAIPDWRVGGDFVREIVEPDLEDALGYRSDELPEPELRTRTRARLAALDAALEPLRAARDAELLADHRRYLDIDVRSAVQAAIAADDFGAARRLLAELPPEFSERSQAPPVERLPLAVRRELESERERLAADLLPRIEDRENEVAAALLAEAQQRFASLERLAADLDLRDAAPWPFDAALDRTRRMLRDVYPAPGAFGDGGRRPWEAVERRLRDLEERGRILRARFDQRILDVLADAAFAAFDRGGPARALAVLGAVEGLVEPAEDRRTRLVAAFESAAAWLAALTAEGPRPVPVVVGDPCALRRADDGVILDCGEAGAPWRSVDWQRLVAIAPPAAGLGVGAALLASSQPDGAGGIDRLGAAEREFLVREALPRWRSALPPPTEREGRAEQALADLLAVRQDGDAARMRLQLERFRAEFGATEVAARAAAVLDELGLVAAADPDGARRLPEGWAGVVGPDGLRGARTELALHAEGAGDGWHLGEPGALHFAPPRAGPDVDAAGRLRLPSPAPIERVVRAGLEVRFGPAEAAPRSVVFAVHGVAVLVSVLPAGNAVALAFDERDVFGGAPEIARRFADALVDDAQPARAIVVPGGWHRLVVEVEPRRGGVALVRARLDDLEFPPAKLEGLDAGAPAELRIAALQAAAFRGLEVVELGR